METFNKIFKLFKKKYWLFLLLVVAISYGQTLWMEVWRDANAIFFKFNHINETAGYLGRGILGEGTYKFSVTPYWFIYKLIGDKYIFPYYLLNLFFYFLAVFFVYRLFWKLISRKVGALAGFLFAAGYIANEGFFSLDSSMILSVSIILICICLIFYKKFSESHKLKDFIFSLFWYAFAAFLTPVRVHYFIGVLFLFDIFWIWKSDLKRIHLLILRMLPYSVLFYFLFIKDADKRTFAIFPFVMDILSGKFYVLYSTLGTLGYLFMPLSSLNYLAHIVDIRIVLIPALLIMFYVIFKANINVKKVLCLNLILSILWYLFSSNIYTSPQVAQSAENILSIILGGEIIIFILSIVLVVKRETKLYVLFLFLWLMGNLISYTSYEPTNIYLSVERYIAHSFVPLVGLLALSIKDFPKRRFTYIVVFCWGVLNLIYNFSYLHNVLLTRSFPTKMFYAQLKKYVPEVEKGDLLYFDIADDARNYFSAAFSVGQMPDETAIAWRYGVDRYDIRRITAFTELSAIVKTGSFGDIHDKPLPLKHIYSFYYSKDGLVNTTDQLEKFLKGNSLNISEIKFTKEGNQYNFEKPLSAVVPQKLAIEVRATVSMLQDLKFPYISDAKQKNNSVAHDINLQRHAFQYDLYKKNQLKTMVVSTSSQWQDGVPSNLNDGDINSVWRPDRILWHEGKDYILIDLRSITPVDRLVWVNAYENNSPTEYAVDLSLDNKNWKEVSHINSVQRIASGVPQVIAFDKTQARFVRMRLVKSLNDDSPGISEIWVVPSRFNELNISETEEFLKNPFGYIEDVDVFNEITKELGGIGKVQVFWKTNKSGGFTTSDSSVLNIKYDGFSRKYTITIPPGGTEISSFKLQGLQIPGSISLEGVRGQK